MNKEIAEIIKRYAIEKHTELNAYLLGKSKDTLVATLLDLLTIYINDKNSSTLREFLTVSLAGYEHGQKKIGYNGFRQSSIDVGKVDKCEAKPKNIDTEKKSKLNGNGNFTDYTFKRLAKDRSEKGLNMVVSGFVEGRLIYVLEFPFAYKKFVNNLKLQLGRHFPDHKDIKGSYLRSANFSYKDFVECEKLRVVFILKKDELEKQRKYIVKGFFDFLLKKAE